MKPWHRLNIDVSNAVQSHFDTARLYAESEFAGKPVGVWTFTNEQMFDVITEEWATYMSTLGFNLTGMILFFRDANLPAHSAHVDIRKDDNHGCAIYAINWLLDTEDDSEMVWYDMPDTLGQDKVSEAGTLYKAWPLSEVSDLEISRCTIKNIPTLVRVNIPHTIIVGSRPRWAISVRFSIEDLVKTWDDAVDKHRQLIEENHE
jgi:hypothetical protein